MLTTFYNVREIGRLVKVLLFQDLFKVLLLYRWTGKVEIFLNGFHAEILEVAACCCLRQRFPLSCTSLHPASSKLALGFDLLVS